MRKPARFVGRATSTKFAALLVTAALAVACGGPSSTGAPASPTASAAASSKTGAFTAPDLKGATIRIAVGAAPDPTDTHVAQMAQILQSWGATTSVVNQTGDPAAIRVILAGQAEVGSIAVSTAINSGLMIFGPSQPRLDYHFIGAPGLKSIKDLPGHVYGTSNVHGLEALMFADLLSKNQIKPDSVTVTIAGGASVRVDAMLTHHIDATFVHFDSVSKLTSAGFNDLAKMSDATPELADSFMGASPVWVKAHPDLATAVDEAWILAARVFNTDKKQWTDAAMKYSGAKPQDASDTYDGLLKANTYPVAKSAFSSGSAGAQEDLASQVGAITSKPALSAWLDTAPWDAATAALGVN
jgi:ABC-type nitrate/sulfonate/bicarbonate transport system substrate-binding protein